MILFHLTPQYKEIQKERVFGLTQWHRPATFLFGTSPISRDENLMQTLLILQDLAKKIDLGLLCTVFMEKGKEKGDVGKDAKWRELLQLLPTQSNSLGLLLSGHLGNNLIASLICDSLFFFLAISFVVVVAAQPEVFLLDFFSRSSFPAIDSYHIPDFLFALASKFAVYLLTMMHSTPRCLLRWM